MDNSYLGVMGVYVQYAGVVLGAYLVVFWPLFVATLCTAIYWRGLKHRGKFFLAAWVAGAGIFHLVFVALYVVLPFVKAVASSEEPAGTLRFVYVVLIGVSIILTFLFIHRLRKTYWSRLYP